MSMNDVQRRMPNASPIFLRWNILNIETICEQNRANTASALGYLFPLLKNGQ